MDIKEIVQNSLSYPFSDWKRFLVLGVLIVITYLDIRDPFLEWIPLSTTNIAMGLSIIIQFVIVLIVTGYLFEIVKSSLDCELKLPKFDSGLNMFINGIKVSIINIFYLIPIVLLIIVFLTLYPSNIGLIPKIIIQNNTSNIFEMLSKFVIYLDFGFWSDIPIIYLAIVYPLIGISIAHMADNHDKLISAFKFRQIFNKISNIGWKKFIVWYLVIGLLYLAIYIGSALILKFSTYITGHYEVIGPYALYLLYIILIVPFLFIYFSRAVALIYTSADKNYLECEKCGGNYELKPGESLEDFEECECGGKLKYHSSHM
jgi:hypothetical protein